MGEHSHKWDLDKIMASVLYYSLSLVVSIRTCIHHYVFLEEAPSLEKNRELDVRLNFSL